MSNQAGARVVKYEYESIAFLVVNNVFMGFLSVL